eukprot:m.192687 g.192687  ORF g.192687 m.192687 type:complete len:1148 (-) comp16771_c0_seq14:5079-8522(-)
MDGPPKAIQLEEILHVYRLDDGTTKDPRSLGSIGQQAWLSGKKTAGFLKALEDDSFNTLRAEGAPVGLVNMGATCYVNSFLQVFFHSIDFRQAIFAYNPPPAVPEERTMAQQLLDQLQRAFALLQATNTRSFAPQDLVTALGLERHVHQDMPEFQKLMLSMIQPELQTQEDNPTIRSFLAGGTCFEGETIRETTCHTCHNASRSKDTFGEVAVHLQTEQANGAQTPNGKQNNKAARTTLEDAIRQHLSEELLVGDNKYHCSHCASPQNATITHAFERLPHQLNFHVMRFSMDWKSGNRTKLTQIVDFPEILDMRSYLRNPKDEDVFELRSLVMHRGISAHSGHYVAQARVPECGDDWYQFDDENAEKLRPINGRLPVGLDTNAATFKESKIPTVTKGRYASDCVYLITYLRRSQARKQVAEQPTIPAHLSAHIEETNKCFSVEYANKASELESDRTYIENNCHKIEEFVRMLEQQVDDLDALEWVPKDFLVKTLKQRVDPPSQIVVEDSPQSEARTTLDVTEFLCPHNKLNPSHVDKMKLVPKAAIDFISTAFPSVIVRRLEESATAACCTACAEAVIAESIRRNNVKPAQTLLKEFRKLNSFEVDKNDSDHVLVLNKALTEFENLKSAPKPQTIFNSDAKCQHGLISCNQEQLRPIPRSLWEAIAKCYTGAEVVLPNEESCNVCLQEDEDQKSRLHDLAQQAKDENAVLAPLRKTTCKRSLSDLLLASNENNMKTLYIVPLGFVNAWRAWQKSPRSRDRPEHLDYQNLLCARHGLFLYDLNQDMNSSGTEPVNCLHEAAEESASFMLVDASIWGALKSIYQPSIAVECTCSNSQSFQVSPPTCNECRLERIETERLLSFHYDQGVVYIHRDDDYDPTKAADESHPSALKANLPAEPEASALQRSSRSTRNQRATNIKTTCDMTLFTLKTCVLERTGIIPADQHLYLDGQELLDRNATLSELHVPRRATLILKADTTAVPDISTRSAEVGFKGTALVGQGPNTIPINSKHEGKVLDDEVKIEGDDHAGNRVDRDNVQDACIEAMGETNSPHLEGLESACAKANPFDGVLGHPEEVVEINDTLIEQDDEQPQPKRPRSATTRRSRKPSLPSQDQSVSAVTKNDNLAASVRRKRLGPGRPRAQRASGSS